MEHKLSYAKSVIKERSNKRPKQKRVYTTLKIFRVLNYHTSCPARGILDPC